MWKEAFLINKTKKVELTGYGNTREFYKVGGVEIELRQVYTGREILCTCKHHSIHANESMCSYKAALIYYLVKKHGKTNKKRDGRVQKVS